MPYHGWHNREVVAAGVRQQILQNSGIQACFQNILCRWAVRCRTARSKGAIHGRPVLLAHEPRVWRQSKVIIVNSNTYIFIFRIGKITEEWLHQINKKFRILLTRLGTRISVAGKKPYTNWLKTFRSSKSICRRALKNPNLLMGAVRQFALLSTT